MPVLLERRAWFPMLIAVLSLAPWAVLSGASPGGQATAAAQPLTVGETVLARLDQHADLESLMADRRTVRRVVWVSKDKQSERVFVDGTPGPAFDKVALNADTFSPDSSRVAYWGKRDKWYAVVDGGWVLVVAPGGTSPAYDEISSVIAFEAPGTATVIARRGTDVLRVVVSLPAKVE